MSSFSAQLRYYVHRLWLFVQRCRHVGGFSIQSPTAFYLDRQVFNATATSPECIALKQQFAGLLPQNDKLAQLYFRLSRHIGKAHWLLQSSHNTLYAAYIMAANPDSTIAIAGDCSANVTEKPADVLLLHINNHSPSLFNAFVLQAKPHTVLIVEGIYDSPENRRVWQQMVNNASIFMAFDLYYCGILFFDSTKSKQLFTLFF